MAGDTRVGPGGVVNTGSVGGKIETNVSITTSTNITADDARELIKHVDAIIMAAKAGPAADFAPEKIATLEQAKSALQGEDKPSGLRLLKDAGTWLFDFATKVGQTVAAGYLKTKLGL